MSKRVPVRYATRWPVSIAIDANQVARLDINIVVYGPLHITVDRSICTTIFSALREEFKA